MCGENISSTNSTEKKNEKFSGTENTYKNNPTMKNQNNLHTKGSTVHIHKTDFSRQKPTTDFKSAREYARITSFHRPSSIQSKTYHVYNFFENKNLNSDTLGSIHNSNFLNDRICYDNDYANKNQISNDRLKRNYSFDDCNLLTEKSVSTRSQNTLKTYPLFVPIKRKNAKSSNPIIEFAFSTTCSTEKTETFLKKRNNVTDSLLDTSESPITNISDSNFENFESDKNNKGNIANNFTLDLHTPANTSAPVAKIDTSLIELTNQVRRNIMAAKSDFDNFIRRTDDTKVRTETNDEIDTVHNNHYTKVRTETNDKTDTVRNNNHTDVHTESYGELCTNVQE